MNEPDINGWIKWNGGECPIDAIVHIDIVWDTLRDLSLRGVVAGACSWGKGIRRGQGCIAYYRLARPDNLLPVASGTAQNVPEPWCTCGKPLSPGTHKQNGSPCYVIVDTPGGLTLHAIPAKGGDAHESARPVSTAGADAVTGAGASVTTPRRTRDRFGFRLREWESNEPVSRLVGFLPARAMREGGK